MRRMIVGGIVAIGLLVGGSLWLLDRMDGGAGSAPPPPKEGVLQPSAPAPRAPTAPPPIELPPPGTPSPTVPVDPVLPPAPPPPKVNLRDTAPDLERELVLRCGAMRLRFADDLRGKNEPLTGQAVLVIEAEPRQDEYYVWSAVPQTTGATRPGLVSCAQLALKARTIPARGVRPGERFKVQLVVGMKE